jgi:hypothetical protein
MNFSKLRIEPRRESRCIQIQKIIHISKCLIGVHGIFKQYLLPSHHINKSEIPQRLNDGILCR